MPRLKMRREFALEKRAVQVGIPQNLNDSCMYIQPLLLKEGLTCDLVELTGRILAKTFAKDMNRLWMVQPTMSSSSARDDESQEASGNRQKKPEKFS
jgi:hypothetical protein